MNLRLREAFRKWLEAVKQNEIDVAFVSDIFEKFFVSRKRMTTVLVHVGEDHEFFVKNDEGKKDGEEKKAMIMRNDRYETKLNDAIKQVVKDEELCGPFTYETKLVTCGYNNLLVEKIQLILSSPLGTD